MKRVLLSMISVLFLSMTYAQVPGTLSYQGILVDNVGAPVADGSHFVKFYFYNDPALEADPANLKYKSEGTGSGNQVTTYKGMFTFIIGSGSTGNDPIPTTIFSTQLYVKVIADGTALTPKIALTTVPYAMNAQNAATAQNATAMDAAGLTGTLAPARIAAGSIDNTHIADGTILAADLNGMGATANQVLQSDGTKWSPANLPAAFSTNNYIPRGNGTGMIASNIFSDGAYTGINRTTPIGASVIDVEGTAAANTYTGMYMSGTDAASKPFYGYATGGTGQVWTYYDGSANLWKVNAGGDRLAVNASNGNVGIGTITPQRRLEVQDGSTGYQLRLSHPNATASYDIGRNIGTGFLDFYGNQVGFTGYAFGGVNGEYMRILNNGKVGIGTATPSSAGLLHVAGGDIAVDGTTYTGIKWVNGNALLAHMHRYGSSNSGLYVTNNGTGNTTGVYLASGGVTWTSTSDRRLKENIVETSYGLDEILQLSVKEFNFKSTKEKDKKIGFIAQEFYKVIPELVQKGDDGEYKGSGNADLSKESGFVPWGVDYAGLTPILVKSTQEQQKQIEDLKATVEELKLQLTQYKGLSAQVEELKKLINDKSNGGSSNSHAATAGGNR